MRRLFSLIVVTLVLCLVMPLTGAAAGTFKDVTEGNTFFKEIELLSSKKIISGYEGGVFKPDISVSRAEAAIMIGRALGLDGKATNTKFRDVTAKVTGSGYIAAAVEEGIIKGYPDGTYRPYEPVTRGQMTIFLDRAFELTKLGCTAPFSDISPNQAAYESIVKATCNGIAQGFLDFTFRPEQKVTRGQFSAFMTRALEPSFRIYPAFAIESVSGWEKRSSIAEGDIDTIWAIQFNDAVEWSSLAENIYVVRERDQKQILVMPAVADNDYERVEILLGDLYEFNEVYTLHIESGIQNQEMGENLSTPGVYKFRTSNPEFTMNKTVEEDGLKQEISIAPTQNKIYVKIKATNVSDKPIPYFSVNGGCDQGMSAHLISSTEAGETLVGNAWRGVSGCWDVVEEYSLPPGKSIEKLEILYPPAQPVNGIIYVKAGLQSEKIEQIKIPLTK